MSMPPILPGGCFHFGLAALFLVLDEGRLKWKMALVRSKKDNAYEIALTFFAAAFVLFNSATRYAHHYPWSPINFTLDEQLEHRRVQASAGPGSPRSRRSSRSERRLAGVQGLASET